MDGDGESLTVTLPLRQLGLVSFLVGEPVTTFIEATVPTLLRQLSRVTEPERVERQGGRVAGGCGVGGEGGQFCERGGDNSGVQAGDRAAGGGGGRRGDAVAVDGEAEGIRQ